MRFKLGDWVCVGDNADQQYVGRVKKITIEETGTYVYVVFGPNENWQKYLEIELSFAHISEPITGDI